MKRCSYCAEILEDDDAYCSLCGKKQDGSGGSASSMQPQPARTGQRGTKAMQAQPARHCERTQYAWQSHSMRRLSGDCEIATSDSMQAYLPRALERDELGAIEQVYKSLPRAHCAANKGAKPCGCINCYGFATEVALGCLDRSRCPYA